MITKFIKGALKDVFANKIRSFLTVLGILIGIASVTMMVSIGGSAQLYINQSITSKLGKNLLIIQPGQQSSGRGGVSFSFSAVLSSLSDKDYKAITGMKSNEVEFVSRRQMAPLKAAYGNVEESTITFAIDPQYFRIVEVGLKSGRYFRLNGENGQDVIIGEGLAKSLFKLQSPIDKKISIGGKEFNVVGVVEEVAASTFGSTYTMYMDTDVYRNTFNMSDKIGSILVAAKADGSVDLLKKQLDRTLRSSRDILSSDDADFSITSQSDIIDTTNTILGTVTLFITVISAISLVVGGVGIMNIMLVSVKERVKEIGLRKAIGATNQDIQTQILIEAVLFSLIGGVLGIFVGIFGAIVIESFASLPLYVSTNAILTSLGVSSMVGIVFGLYPAIQAGKLSPIEALRSN